jgi:hypothetical protein
MEGRSQKRGFYSPLSGAWHETLCRDIPSVVVIQKNERLGLLACTRRGADGYWLEVRGLLPIDAQQTDTISFAFCLFTNTESHTLSSPGQYLLRIFERRNTQTKTPDLSGPRKDILQPCQKSAPLSLHTCVPECHGWRPRLCLPRHAAGPRGLVAGPALVLSGGGASGHGAGLWSGSWLDRGSRSGLRQGSRSQGLVSGGWTSARSLPAAGRRNEPWETSRSPQKASVQLEIRRNEMNTDVAETCPGRTSRWQTSGTLQLPRVST